MDLYYRIDFYKNHPAFMDADDQYIALRYWWVADHLPYGHSCREIRLATMLEF